MLPIQAVETFSTANIIKESFTSNSFVYFFGNFVLTEFPKHKTLGHTKMLYTAYIADSCSLRVTWQNP